MGKLEKILLAILRGSSDNNIAFADLRSTLESPGFEARIKGSHFIYTKQGIAEIVNIQPIGNQAKSYQVKQVRNLILKYKLIKLLAILRIPVNSATRSDRKPATCSDAIPPAVLLKNLLPNIFNCSNVATLQRKGRS